MPEAANVDTPVQDPTAEDKVPSKAAASSFWGRLLSPRWILVIVGVSVAVHGLGYAYYRFIHQSGSGDKAPEVSLGRYHFEAAAESNGRVARAEFSLHIAVLEDADRAARHRLAERKYRVQQDVEELLRQAHSGDFEDPKLGELKRQLQEQINQTLGMRAIRDVVITELELTLGAKSPVPVTDTVGPVPWADEPAG